LFLPGGTDKAIAVKLQEAVARILTESDTRKMLLGQGLDVVGSTTDEFQQMYAAEIAKWAKVVRTIGLQPN
jgi:tripartite-type tricarboxylate transporter receptor subunit TctC